MNTIVFYEVKDEILRIINSCPEKFGIEEPVTLFPGFLNIPLCLEITGKTMIGGDTLPMVLLIGNTSSKVYLFALKSIIDI